MVQREPAGNLNLGSWFTVSSLRALTLLGLGIESELSLLSLCATVRVNGSGLRVVGW